jgi:hypothetical protein
LKRRPVRQPEPASHERVAGDFLPSEELGHRERQVHVAGEIPDDIIDAIENSEYLKPAS